MLYDSTILLLVRYTISYCTTTILLYYDVYYYILWMMAGTRQNILHRYITVFLIIWFTTSLQIKLRNAFHFPPIQHTCSFDSTTPIRSCKQGQCWCRWGWGCWLSAATSTRLLWEKGIVVVVIASITIRKLYHFGSPISSKLYKLLPFKELQKGQRVCHRQQCSIEAFAAAAASWCPNFPLIPGRFAHHSRSDYVGDYANPSGGIKQHQQSQSNGIPSRSRTRKSMRHHQERKLLPAPPLPPLSPLERGSQWFRRFFFCHNDRKNLNSKNTTWWPQLLWHAFQNCSAPMSALAKVSKEIFFGLVI